MKTGFVCADGGQAAERQHVKGPYDSTSTDNAIILPSFYNTPPSAESSRGHAAALPAASPAAVIQKYMPPCQNSPMMQVFLISPGGYKCLRRKQIYDIVIIK